MKITIKEVAKEAGVSIATVSRVLNRKDGIKPATRKKVEKAIDKYSFIPDQIARTMIMRETKTIGVLVPQLSNEYWATLAAVIEEELWKCGYTLLLSTSSTREDCFTKEMAAIESFMQKKVDGIIYSTSSGNHPNFQAYTEKMVNYPTPIVAYDHKIPGLSQVFGDHLQGAMDAVSHLITLGHQKNAYIGGPLVSPERELGFRNAHTVQGLPVDESLIMRGEPTFKFGYQSMTTLLYGNKSFTGVFCGNDLIALGAIQALERAGKRVPGDIAIVGYDDIHTARYVKPALTTVRQPLQEMGKAAVELLLHSIENNGQRLEPRNLVFPMQLIVRESCGTMVKPEISFS